MPTEHQNTSRQYDSPHESNATKTQVQLSACLAIALAVAFVGILGYEYYRIRASLAPDKIGDRVEAAISENYPEFREKLVANIKEQAPEIAEQVSTEALAATPRARQKLEQFTARQIDRAIAEGTTLSAEQFREVLRQNHEQIAKTFEKIETAPKEAHELVLAMEQDIEQALEIDVQTQAKRVLAAHRNLNDELEKLSDPNAQLEPDELLELRIVRILRAMQLAEDSQVASFAGPN